MVEKIVNENGVFYYLNGYHHKEDGPAVEYTNGTKCWYKNGHRHREDGPAIEYADGTKFWLINDYIHRQNGPAIEFASGDKEYWYNGEMLDCSTDEEYFKIINYNPGGTTFNG